MRVCVNRSPDCAICPNYEVVDFQPQSVIATVLDSLAYFYVLLPCILCYSSPRLSFHTRETAHPGVARLCTRISTYRTRSTSQPGVSCICPIILNTRYASLPSPGSYCAALLYRRLLLLASREISSRVVRTCLSAPPPLHHHAYILQLPPPRIPSRLIILQILV